MSINRLAAGQVVYFLHEIFVFSRLMVKRDNRRIGAFLVAI